SRTNNAGTTATFIVTASGTAPTYQWKKNGVNLSNGGNVSGATTATLTLTGVSQTDAASYTVGITNAAGGVLSSAASLTVIDPPSTTTQPSSRTNNAGTTATFTVTASGTGPLSYQWRFNGTDISAATSGSLMLGNVQAEDAGDYSV